MKNKRLLCLITFIFFTFSVSACKNIQKKDISTLNDEKKSSYTIITKPNTISIDKIGTTTALITKEKGISQREKIIDGKKYSYVNAYPMATKKYLAYEDSEKQLESGFENGEKNVNVKSFILKIYKIDKENVSIYKEIDVKNIVEEFNKKYSPYLIENMVLANGQTFAVVNIYNSEKKSLEKNAYT